MTKLTQDFFISCDDILKLTRAACFMKPHVDIYYRKSCYIKCTINPNAKSDRNHNYKEDQNINFFDEILAQFTGALNIRMLKKLSFCIMSSDIWKNCEMTENCELNQFLINFQKENYWKIWRRIRFFSLRQILSLCTTQLWIHLNIALQF